MTPTLTVDEVKALSDEGLSVKEIAAKMNCTYMQCRSFMIKNNIKRNVLVKGYAVEDLETLLKTNTVKEVSRITGIAPNNLYSFINNHNVKFKTKYLSKKEDKSLLKAMIITLSKDFSASAIIQTLHLPYQLVYNTIRENDEIYDSKRRTSKEACE